MHVRKPRSSSSALAGAIATFWCVVATLVASPSAAAAPLPGGHLTAAGSFSCVVRSDATVKCWGDDGGQAILGGAASESTSLAVVVRGLNGVKRIASGGGHSCALLDTGRVSCWGQNLSGGLGNGTRRASNVPVSVVGIANAVDVAAGELHSCAVLKNGTVKCWGENSSGQLGNGKTRDSLKPMKVRGLGRAVHVASSMNHTCALTSSGTARCWGDNSFGALGNGRDVSSKLAVRVRSLKGAVQLATGANHSCALLATGSIKCWGANGGGQLGRGSIGRSTKPNNAKPVRGIANATQISTGWNHSCAVLADATVKCWGSTGFGATLGNGSYGGSPTPVNVSGLNDATEVAAGYDHACALRASGAARCWGSNNALQLGSSLVDESPDPLDVMNLP